GDRNPEFLMGTADNTRTVLFKGDDALIGKLVMVKVTRAMSPHLVEGELVEVLG
ncbi:MAG: TRAM domain-containing protein, partial [Moraxella sp.]|nr:TRAM domain-containing protein [Moraxella sp.]